MSTLTMFIAWLLSLVGLQDCEADPTHPDCPPAIATTNSTSGPVHAQHQQPIGLISNGL